MTESQNQPTAFKPEQILEIVIRRRWIILIPLCVIITLGFFYTLQAPQSYRASTTILIQPQKVPTDYVQSIVTTDIEQRINTISQQILSRTNLEKIIKEFGFFENRPDMYMEEKVANIRKRVGVQQQSSRRQGTEAFSVSFTGSSPQRVRDVANKLATIFMDENLKVRESLAIGTSDFLESELEKIRQKLENREAALARYRAKYMGGLPDELETNLRTLDRLQAQLTDSLSALRENQNAMSLLKNQISRLREFASDGDTSVQPDGRIVRLPLLSEEEQQLEQEKRRLAEIKLKYTDKHPEVIRLSKSVDRLTKQIEQNESEKKEGPAEGQVSESAQEDTAKNQVLIQQELSLKQLENERASISKTIQQIKKNMRVYQERVEDTPKREQELQSIQRDYNNIRESYNSLLARRLEAELAVNMEKKQKGEQFRIIDYAVLPQKPFSPDVRKLLLMSIVVGLGIGGGIVFLMEFLNPAIRSEAQIEIQTGLPVLASIPALEKAGDRIKKRIGRGFFTIVVIYGLFIFGLFALLHLKGINATIISLKTYIQL